MTIPNDPGRLPPAHDSPDGVDLDRVWAGVAAEIWRRHPAHGRGRERARLSALPRGRGLLCRDRRLRNTPATGVPVNVDMRETPAARSGKTERSPGWTCSWGPVSSGCSAPTGQGRPPCCGCSPPCCRRRRGRSGCPAGTRAARSRLSAALAGTLCWLLLAFLACVAVLYVQTALQATRGGPPLWPALVGAAGVTVVTVTGFTCGAVFPGRFTAPLVALGTAVLSEIGFREALTVRVSSGRHALPSPANAPLRFRVLHELTSLTSGLAGLGLACSLATGGLLARVLPLGYMAYCQYALIEAWNAPWTWPARPPADRGGWIAAVTVLSVALLPYTLRGPRTRPSDNA